MKLLLALAAIGVVLLCPRPVAGQEAPAIQVDVRPSFDGWFDRGRWVALQVDLQNDGPGTDVVLRAALPGGQRASFSVPVELPHGAHKQLPIYVMADSERLRLYVERDGRPVVPDRVVMLRDLRRQRLVAVISDGQAKLTGLSGPAAQPKWTLVSVRPNSLPERSLAMGSVDLMILAGTDLTDLTEAQRQALHAWVALGGELIVAGGAAVGPVLDSLPEGLRPAVATGKGRVADLSPLGELTHRAPPAGDGGALIALLEPLEGATVSLASAADEAPLVVERTVGEGVVVALAFDPAAPPIRGWTDIDRMWAVLDRSRPGSLWVAEQPVPGRMAVGVGALPEFELPSINWTLLVLALYIIVVGPLNYMLLRRRRRLDQAWITIPVLTLAATGAIYGFGYSTHGGALIVYELSAVRVVPDAGVAHIRTFVGLFSPASREYDIEVEGALVYPLRSSWTSAMRLRSGPLDIRQGQSSVVRGLAVHQWSLGGFAAESVVRLPVADVGELVIDGAAVSGTLYSPFVGPLSGAQAVVPGDWQWIGRLSPGGRYRVKLLRNRAPRVKLDMSLLSNKDPPSHAQGQLRAGILAAALNGAAGAGDYGGDPLYSESYYYGRSEHDASSAVLEWVNGGYLFGWDMQAPMDVRVAGRRVRRQVQTLQYVRVPIRKKARAGSSLPDPGYVTGVVTGGFQFSGRRCGRASLPITDRPFEAQAIFELGRGQKYPDRLWLVARGAAGVGVPLLVAVELKGERLEVGELLPGQALQLPEAKRLIEAGRGRVIVTITAAGGTAAGGTAAGGTAAGGTAAGLKRSPYPGPESPCVNLRLYFREPGPAESGALTSGTLGTAAERPAENEATPTPAQAATLEADEDPASAEKE